ncbi:hypothetical protein ATANTOWER_028801 [Ataeniobius toweri]|uniref:Uncharacterized protein n=1 Tax=Ataeniobius toweri TaxID=208326 RepID=A0ABU7CBQ3_9TELE|nr:hypothetical protein [Ataeniobius toweri]
MNCEGSRPLLTADPPVDSVRTTAGLALRVFPCSEQMPTGLAAGSTQEVVALRYYDPAADVFPSVMFCSCFSGLLQFVKLCHHCPQQEVCHVSLRPDLSSLFICAGRL